MTAALTLTRDEADRLDTEGQVVLFRPGAVMVSTQRMTPDSNLPGTYLDPPAEFTAAAKPCETCGGLGDIEGRNIASWDACHDCLDGKRRITAVVECNEGGVHEWQWATGTGPLKTTRHMACNGRGVVTVATVVVEWGPALVVERPSQSPTEACVTILPRGIIGYWPRDDRPDADLLRRLVNAWTPDVDPQALVGQYALRIRKVSDD